MAAILARYVEQDAADIARVDAVLARIEQLLASEYTPDPSKPIGADASVIPGDALAGEAQQEPSSTTSMQSPLPSIVTRQSTSTTFNCG